MSDEIAKENEKTDEIALPSTLSGTYEIRLVRGSITFVGEIEL